ncbi:MAG: hypothetical protein ACRD0A_06225 [Acidimicrobiales bacterium]
MTSATGPGPPRRAPVSWVVVVVALLAAAVAVAVAVVAWLQPRPDLDREDARQFTAGALEAAGFTEGSVRPEVRADAYPEPEGDAEFDVWVTITDLEGQPVELWIDRERAQAVLVNDNTADGPLLTEDQFQILDDYDIHPGADDRRRRNWIVTATAGLVVVLAGLIVFIIRRSRPT